LRTKMPILRSGKKVAKGVEESPLKNYILI
jgi:hypothetical protein